ncbi:hypothetical protein HanRHA438_Chr10g0469351 [Helianthus annuus]|nr:hypothetical protein HanRHA438_Chr10g0469351 [Helianthus annuus]
MTGPLHLTYPKEAQKRKSAPKPTRNESSGCDCHPYLSCTISVYKVFTVFYLLVSFLHVKPTSINIRITTYS